MPEKFSKEKRSAIMRAVKGQGNLSTELKLIAIFKAHRVTGWRRNYPLYGKPDFVFPKKRVILFADGCFWHGHHCRNVTPKNNADYWQKKISRNKLRDKAVTKYLKTKNWEVFRIFECKIKKAKLPGRFLKALA